jgi:hypothetical protein
MPDASRNAEARPARGRAAGTSPVEREPTARLHDSKVVGVDVDRDDATDDGRFDVQSYAG